MISISTRLEATKTSFEKIQPHDGAFLPVDASPMLALRSAGQRTWFGRAAKGSPHFKSLWRPRRPREALHPRQTKGKSPRSRPLTQRSPQPIKLSTKKTTRRMTDPILLTSNLREIESGGDTVSFAQTYAYLTREQLQRLCDAMDKQRRVGTLLMSHTGLTTDTLHILMPVVAKLDLLKFSLRANSLGASAMEVVCPVFPSLANLKELDLSYNPDLLQAGCVMVASALYHLPALEYLNMASCGMDSEAAEALAKGIVQCPLLEVLDIGSNLLGPKGGAAIASALPSCWRLEDLQMNQTGISTQGAVAIAEALLECPSLEKLELGHCQVGVYGALALARVVGDMPFLEEIGLDYDELNDEAVLALASAVLRSESLTTISLQYNDDVSAYGSEVLRWAFESQCDVNAYLAFYGADAVVKQILEDLGGERLRETLT